MKKYHDSLIEALQNPEEAAEYLNAALEEGDTEMLLVALRNVAEAHGGMSKVSRETELNRANLYKMLSKNGNPEIKTLDQVLHIFGLRVLITTIKKSQRLSTELEDYYYEKN